MRVIFDLETTSADKDTCRIVQMAIKQIDDEGNVLISKSKLYNPGIPITPTATEAHGITDEMVKDCPRFASDAKKLKKIFEHGTLIGYNIITFDIPVLLNEFERAGVDIDMSRDVIDSMRLETQISPRTLGAVYERYTGKKLEGAHDAMNDVNATEIVLNKQLARISQDNELNQNIKELREKAGIPKDAADMTGKLKYDENGNLYYNFGKHKDHLVLESQDTRQYANWILNNKDFSNQVKKFLKKELQKDSKQQFTHTPAESKAKGFYNPPKKLSLFGEEQKPDDSDLPF